ncbi:hypothetical protein M408DRAFT_27185 [Serendipita vermifera MAFF 305830]|uniref:Uncharacterized protein n=1 Tax=Serendipita vermifera MAFF 305830 TaxID=933852 RepID=A0A0C3AW45_SERVB|nr:hypothetical protein M408DRAFT_27185 [Serendipita vermifera MAFF 305830]
MASLGTKYKRAAALRPLPLLCSPLKALRAFRPNVYEGPRTELLIVHHLENLEILSRYRN